MRDRFIKWLSGTPPVVVGAWCGRVGVCLVRKNHAHASDGLLEAMYEPCGLSSVTDLDGSGLIHGEIVNALRCAVEGFGKERVRLALGVPSGDIFIKNIEIPSGLSAKQIEQLSVVEAVSNLPVPPDEICADFLRRGSAKHSNNDHIDVAFCKRGLIDELSILAEDAGVLLSIVDRDIQAIHDATVWCAERNDALKLSAYPLGIIVSGDAATFQICRSDLDLISFQMSSIASIRDGRSEDISSIQQEVMAYCRRAGLTDEHRAPLEQLFVVGEADALGGIELSFEGVAKQLTKVNPRAFLKGSFREAPLYSLMVAMGMSLRANA